MTTIAKGPQRLVLDLFAGPGGWDEGVKPLGLSPIGIEWDEAACLTGTAAGHTRLRADVAAFALGLLVGKLWGLIASPSCTLFSNAGKGTGRAVLDEISDCVRDLFVGKDTREQLRALIYPVALADQAAKNDERPESKKWTQERLEEAARSDAFTAALIVEPARYIEALRPEWICLEQVPQALAVWVVYAVLLRAMGYSVWTGVLNAADYGVPQTRQRAILIASTVRTVERPEPTHERGGGLDLFAEREDWVSMASALGWGPNARMEQQRGEGMTERHGDRPIRTGSEPAFTITSGVQRQKLIDRDVVFVNGTQANAARRPVDQPAPTIHFGHRTNDVRWVVDRRTNSRGAAGTVVPTVPVPVTEPAPTFTGKSGSQWVVRDTEDDAAPSYRVSVQEAAVLQSFPPDYPWRGTKTKQYEQVGNAVPPRLALHVVAAVLGVKVPALDVAA